MGFLNKTITVVETDTVWQSKQSDCWVSSGIEHGVAYEKADTSSRVSLCLGKVVDQRHCARFAAKQATVNYYPCSRGDFNDTWFYNGLWSGYEETKAFCLGPERAGALYIWVGSA